MILKNKPLAVLIATAIFLSPINLFVKWGESQAYVGGIFSDYLVQKLWIGELPLLIILLLWLPKKILVNSKKISSFLKKNIWLLIALLTLAIRQFYTPIPVISLWYLLKVVELVVFYWALRDSWTKISKRLIEYSLLFTVLFQAGVGILQFTGQRSLFSYQVLGETQLSGSINIARTSLIGKETILAYGTTAHPNILAGLVVVFGLLWLRLRLAHLKSVGWPELSLIILMIIVLFITQSYGAILALSIFLTINSFPKLLKHTRNISWVIALLVPLLLLAVAVNPASQSVFRRAFLNAHAVVTFQQQPLLGTGLGLFTTSLKNTQTNELVRFVQPAHNVFLLLLAEIGILGGWAIWLILKQTKKILSPAWLPMLIVLLSFDHYLVTQWVGGVMLLLIFSSIVLIKEE